MTKSRTGECSIEGCGDDIKARGWCSSHYLRWSKYGDPLAGGTKLGEPYRFIKTVALPYEGNECLRWPFGTSNDGRGHLTHKGRKVLAHRLVCELVNGPPPSPNHDAAHECGKGHWGCVTPGHLRWKTKKENQADRRLHGTMMVGEKCNLSKLTEPQVRGVLAAKGTATQEAIAARFGIAQSHVSRIHNGKNWSHLSTSD